MTRPSHRHLRLTPDLLLRAYSAGLFPMAESRDDPNVFWVDPRRRGILPLDRFHVPRSLRRAVRRKAFTVRCDSAFDAVIGACAAPSDERRDTWINPEIEHAYIELHRLGFAHSVECWRGPNLVGGLYGVALGAAFFGESMFSRVSGASKVALVHLVARLIRGAFTLLDVQFVTPHLRRFGAVELPAREYHRRLDAALRAQATFYSVSSPEEEDSAVEAVFRQSSTQTS
jgi:leucyl/phenylalanyl-tRNA---protein transferase